MLHPTLQWLLVGAGADLDEPIFRSNGRVNTPRIHGVAGSQLGYTYSFSANNTPVATQEMTLLPGSDQVTLTMYTKAPVMIPSAIGVLEQMTATFYVKDGVLTPDLTYKRKT